MNKTSGIALRNLMFYITVRYRTLQRNNEEDT